LSLKNLYFGHCFGFRASDFEFLTEKTGFSVKHYISNQISFQKKAGISVSFPICYGQHKILTLG